MTYQSFTESLQNEGPPADLNPLLTALWHDKSGNWRAAHHIAQSSEGTPAYDVLHAYLHRVEGDIGNAGYWYRRARRPVFDGPLGAEWEALVREFLTI
ncbi:MAG: hypothetical protein LH606_05030 [Cytophagaceae bacterium]|nr:hypothetical protein [Cytophagaceae bacterium]